MPLPAIDTNRELGKSIFCLLYLPVSEMNIIKDSKGCDSALMNVIQFFLMCQWLGKFQKREHVIQPSEQRTETVNAPLRDLNYFVQL